MSRVTAGDSQNEQGPDGAGARNGGANGPANPAHPTVRTLPSPSEPRRPVRGDSHDDAPAEDQAEAKPSQPDAATAETKPEEPKKPRVPLYRRPVFWIVVGVILIGALVAFCLWFFIYRFEVQTDDAFVSAHSTTVSARVAGHVSAVLVDDNQYVKKGDLLAVLDDRDLAQAVKGAAAQLESAKAQLVEAEAQLASSKASVAEAQADVSSAEASAKRADDDRDRYRNLQQTDKRAVSQQQVDQADATARTSDAQVASARQKKDAAEANVKVAEAQIVAGQAMIAKAQSDLDNANLQLSYGHVCASEDGQVTQRTVEVGNWITAGQALMSVVPREVYVIANYKETQLQKVRENQRVKIHVDAFGVDLWGKVQSIQAGSGAAFSLLPPENATGNYVKVVQRVPVKIVFDDVPRQRLSPGMSVEPTILTRDGD